MADTKKKKRGRDQNFKINSSIKSKNMNYIGLAKKVGERHLVLHNHQMYDIKE